MQTQLSQESIKYDLELSFLKTKVKLLEETLNHRSKDLKTLEAFKENNTHLLQVLDKYDIKLTKMQEDIDVRDLRIHELLEKHEEDGKGTTNYTLIILLIYVYYFSPGPGCHRDPSQVPHQAARKM